VKVSVRSSVSPVSTYTMFRAIYIPGVKSPGHPAKFASPEYSQVCLQPKHFHSPESRFFPDGASSAAVPFPDPPLRGDPLCDGSSDFPDPFPAMPALFSIGASFLEAFSSFPKRFLRYRISFPPAGQTPHRPHLSFIAPPPNESTIVVSGISRFVSFERSYKVSVTPLVVLGKPTPQLSCSRGTFGRILAVELISFTLYPYPAANHSGPFIPRL